MNHADTLHPVLMVAYLYPPRESTSTIRTVKFARYLPECGYQPLILTTRIRGTLPDDAERLVFRSGELTEPLHRAYRAYKLRRVPPQQRARANVAVPESRLYALQTMLSLPDYQMPWYLPAVWLGKRLLRRFPIRLLYSTSPPETSHLVALALKRQRGLPWVADFRDGWLFEPAIALRHTSRLRYGIEAHLERRVVQHADHIVVVNEVMADDMRRRYPAARQKITVITNGYDAADFAQVRPRTPAPGRFRLVYTGSFPPARWQTSMQGFLTALSMMQTTNRAIMRHLEMLLVGELTAAQQAAIEQAGIQNNVTLAGSVPYHQALQYQADADVLLLVIAARSVGITTNKVFEYLATGRPILVLAQHSPAADLIASLGAGLVVAPHDSVGIQRALETLYQQWQAGLLPTRVPPGVRQFERRELTRRLAALFDSLHLAP
jgi:glycosyltransferase involved in cell wall biosynthesis